MSWTDNDDKEVQENLDRLQDKQKEFQLITNPMEIIINNLRKIQTKTQISYTVVNGERIQQTKKIKPIDEWGDNMTDKDRLEDKSECIAKTIELLGASDE